MKYLKRYEVFLNENINLLNKNIDKNLIIVEKQVLGDFSNSFWHLSLNSNVFTGEEKNFIKENLLSIKVDLVTEAWLTDTLSGIWDKAKEAGGKLYTKIKNKITIIKDNIKKLCSGISDFIKDMFKSISKSLVAKSQSLKGKVADFESKVQKVIKEKKPKDADLGNEFKQLQATYQHLKESLQGGLFVGNVDASDDKVISDAESQVGELETELKTESSNYDILSAFYITEADETEEVEYKVGDKVKYKMKDGGQAEKEIVKIDGDNIFFKDKDGKEFSKTKDEIIGKAKGTAGKIWAGFSKWFLEMEESTPPQKDKAVWWIKLILKIVALILSPIVKLLEGAVRFISSNVLKGVSVVTKTLSGPGVFEFLVLGGIVAGIPALITEFTLVSHKMPEPFAHIFEIVSHFLAEAAGFKVLITVFGAICTALTFAELCNEFKHLFGGHGGEHGEPKQGQPTA